MVTTINLEAYYKFDENAANTTVADSHSTNTGTSSTNTSNLFDASGKINSAFDLSGVNESVSLGSSFPSIYGETNFSVSVWFNADVVSSAQEALVADHVAPADSNTGFILRVSTFFYNTATTLQNWNFDEGTITAGNWYHYVLTFESGVGFKLYKNGALQDSLGTGSVTIRSQVNNLRIGAYGSGTTQEFNGRIDEVAFWNRTLTLTDVQDLYNSGNGLAYPFTTATVRLIRLAGTFVEKPILTKVAGTFVDKPIKIKVGGTFQ